MASVAQIKKSYEGLKKRVGNMKEKAESTLGEAINTAETVASGSAFGYVRGRFGNADSRWLLLDVDGDLSIGLGLHALAFVGMFGKYEEHAHAIANGALTCYGTLKGLELGKKAKSKATTSGQLPARQPRVTESVYDRAWERQAA